MKDAPKLSGRHTEPVAGCGFDDDGNRVAICDFAYPDDSADSETTARADFEAKLARFLGWLVDGNSVESAGRKALLVAHLCHKSSAKDDAQFAKKVGVSKARISQLRREIGNGFKRLSKLNSR